jgi:DNA modification methylase
MIGKKQNRLELNDPNRDKDQDAPVECLGKTFANDAERRAYYLGLLAEKLQDPEFRKIEGFPIGEDEDIIELSDPPYYTACPNPFIVDFINYYGRPYDPAEGYKREPYAADVSEGKNDPIYNAHSYHTKVPHKAIMRYILHYTNPGDVILDSFCGTGMMGVAAKLCGDRVTVESLGYKVLPNGAVLEKKEKVEDGSFKWELFSKLGPRIPVLNDLSPAASFIARNYNSSINSIEFLTEAESLIALVEAQYGWMYEVDIGEEQAVVNYTVWSDVFFCDSCQSDVIFFDARIIDGASSKAAGFLCENCGCELSKTKSEQQTETAYAFNGELVTRLKKVPVLIDCTLGSGKRIQKEVDASDYKVLEKINSIELPFSSPDKAYDKGREQYKRDALHLRGIETASDFYTRRNLIILSELWIAAKKNDKYSNALCFLFTSIQWLASNMYRHRDGGGGGQQGKLTIPSLIREKNAFHLARDKLKDILKIYNALSKCDSPSLINVGDATLPNTSQLKEVLDYIFIDPPFGGNIFYTDLNSIWEGWLKVHTNDLTEAVIHKVQKVAAKELSDYGLLMKQSLKSSYRLLKPGRWITVEFSNSQASIWNSIQDAVQEAGFVIANVSALDKKQRSFRSVTSPTAVKQDLVISAYKPNGGFEERFEKETDEEGVWDFVRTHLSYLPVVKKQGDELNIIPDRDPRILFDQVVAYFVRNLRDIPLSSKEFQEGLLERFAERDGMMFLPEQVVEYDKARITSKQLRQLSIFVDDEASAIEWIRQLLNDKPQSYQDIHPKFINELSGWKKAEEQLELFKLLDQNFIKYDGDEPLPPQIHSHLSTYYKEMRNLSKDDPQLIKKAKDRWYVPNPGREEDLQKLRDRDLLKQFEEYKIHTGRKLKTVRLEAVRCGFKKAWQDRDYVTIINIAEKIPQNLLQEDQKLLMWYDQAQTRHSDESLF